MKANPKRWVVSGTMTQITFRKVTRDDYRYPRGRTYHETWEEARIALLQRVEMDLAKDRARLFAARRNVASAERAVERAMNVQRPSEDV